jgi:hypothetical protein
MALGNGGRRLVSWTHEQRFHRHVRQREQALRPPAGGRRAQQVVKISTDVLSTGNVDVVNVLGVVAWFAVFLGLAAFAVRSATEIM